jgi:predicted nucleic acid-binding protein
LRHDVVSRRESDVEVIGALRRLVRAGDVRVARAEEAIDDLGLIGIVRHGHVDLAPRVWELRQNFTAYDAMYLALAEALDATVVTCDRPFAGAAGRTARVEAIR